MTPALAALRRKIRLWNAARWPVLHAHFRADADFAVALGVPRMRDLRLALDVRRALRATVLP